MTTISGTVDIDGTATEGVTVYLINQVTSEIADQTTTDANGYYEFTNAANGQSLMVAPWYYDAGTNEWFVDDSVVNVANSDYNTLPDSAVLEFYLNAVVGGTIYDSIGNNTASVPSESWTSDLYSVGSYRLSFDGSNWGTSTIDIGQYSTWGYAYTMQTGSAFGAEEPAASWDEDGSYGEINMGRGDPIELNVGDGNAGVNATASTNVFDGSKHRIFCYCIEGSEIGIAVDGTVEGTASFGTMGPVSNSYYLARNERTGTNATVDEDHIVLYTDASQSTIDADYAFQPWS